MKAAFLPPLGLVMVVSGPSTLKIHEQSSRDSLSARRGFQVEMKSKKFSCCTLIPSTFENRRLT